MISLIGNQAQPVLLSPHRLNMAEILSYHSDKTPGDGISFRELKERTSHKARAVYSSLCTGRCWARENKMKSESLKYILPSVCDPCSESISLAASALLLNSMSERWSSLVLAAVGLKCCFPASEPNTVPQLKDPPNTHTHRRAHTERAQWIQKGLSSEECWLLSLSVNSLFFFPGWIPLVVQHSWRDLGLDFHLHVRLY